MTDADNKLMLATLRKLQAGQAEMNDRMTGLNDRMTGLAEEVRATRRVLLDAFVQLEMRVARIEAQP